MVTVGDFDRKAAAMRAAGFDPGKAVGPVRAVKTGHIRRYKQALLTHEATAGLHEVHGPILRRYDQINGPAGHFGFPTTDQTVAGNGHFNRFQFLGSAITWHPTFGVHEVHGFIGDEYWSRLGGPTGKGFPISDVYPRGPTDLVSNFFGGDLAYAPTAPGAAPTVTNLLGPPGIPTHGNWPGTPEDLRITYCMKQLIERYDLSHNGAAGLVGNLVKESQILPMMIEGSFRHPQTPMRGVNWQGVLADFSADDIMNRRGSPKLPNGGPGASGPRFPGIGLAQWTDPGRRAGLFRHSYHSVVWGSNILFSMDAQIDYLVTELSTGFRSVLATVRNPKVTVDAASDKVLRDFERPGNMGPAEVADRRKSSQRAKALYP